MPPRTAVIPGWYQLESRLNGFGGGVKRANDHLSEEQIHACLRYSANGMWRRRDWVAASGRNDGGGLLVFAAGGQFVLDVEGQLIVSERHLDGLHFRLDFLARQRVGFLREALLEA